MNLLLKNRSLLILGLAESVSNIGNWITMMALFALVLFRGEGGVVESSGILLAGLGPMLLLGPVAGWLSDRFDRKRLMIGAQLLSALPVVGLILFGEGLLIYLLLAIQAAFISLMTPARQAAVPTLVDKEDLARANAFLQQLSSFVKIGAPMLGGAIVAATGPQLAMALDVATFFLAAAVLALLPALPPHRQTDLAAVDETPARTPAAWPTLRQSPRLRLLFLALFLGVVIIMGFDILSPLVVRDVLRANESLFGVIIGLVGLGSVLASLVVLSRKEAVDPWRDVVVGVVCFAFLPLTTFAAGRLADPVLARWLVGSGALIGGIGNGFVIVQVGTLLQLLSPAAVLGRLSGLLQSTVAAGQLLTIFAAPLLVPALLSLTAFFALSALALTLLAGLIVIILRRTQGEPAAPVAHASNQARS